MYSKTLFVFLVVYISLDFSYGQNNQMCFREDYTYIEEGESCYKFHTTEKNWRDANRECALEGASLFYPENSDEANAVISFWTMYQNNTQPRHTWIFVGISDILSEGVYNTIDGKSISQVYRTWGLYQPDNSGNEDCLHLNQAGHFNDIRCHAEYSFICKKRLPSQEQSCSCNIQQYNLDGTCISAGAVCDTYEDCPDNSDEASCYSSTNSNVLNVTIWKLASRPNYITNIDKRFPYSEVPYLGEYDLVKIPANLSDLIQHVDYWGEGKVVTKDGIRGFSNCYNVNHQYQLVSSGPDLDSKIPNRIPLLSFNNCDTSGYIRDSSVLTVTVVGANMTSSCAKDIARIVNRDHGKVVVYGVQRHSQKISKLIDELKKKGFTSSPGATLPRELQGLTYYDSHVVLINTHTIKEEWYNNVVNGNYDTAVNMSQNFETTGSEFIKEILTRLISSAPRNVMSLAYKLWHGGAKDIVRKYFPPSFQHVFNENAVTIVNKRYKQPLKLDLYTNSYNDRLAWGDDHQCQITSERVSWKVLPVWNRDGVTFKLYNIHRNMYLKLDVNADSIGDRKAWGSTNSDEVRDTYYLEPLVKNGTLELFIINCKYNQGLKLALNEDGVGDRLVWGHNGSVHNEDERFRWVIAAW